MTDRDGAQESWAHVRTDFPYARECVYLNTAAAGLSWTGQGAAAAKFYDDAKQRGMNGMSRWREVADDARARVARLVGGGVSEDEIRFVSSTTEGLNLIAHALRWRPGDEIVVAEDEFASVMLACESAERSGASVRRVRVPSEAQREAALIDAITARTRVVAVSHVHWATGTRLDLMHLSAACKPSNALLLVDGVQALGAVPVDLGDAGAYCASVFKWLISGFGLAILIVRESVQRELRPAVRGYNNPPPSTDLQYSHVNYPGIFALAASLEYLETRIGWERLYGRVAALAAETAATLLDRGLDVVTPAGAHAGIVSCAMPNPAGVRDALARQNIFVEAREGLLRVAPHFYNTSEDIGAFAAALGAI